MCKHFWNSLDISIKLSSSKKPGSKVKLGPPRILSKRPNFVNEQLAENSFEFKKHTFSEHLKNLQKSARSGLFVVQTIVHPFYRKFRSPGFSHYLKTICSVLSNICRTFLLLNHNSHFDLLFFTDFLPKNS